MAGLPCEACQEEAIVIPAAQIVEDAGGRLVYRRYRACANPACELYLVRRETLEVFAPLTPDAPFVPTSNANLRKTYGELPPRRARFPFELVPEHLLPTLTKEEITVVELARYLGQISRADVRERLECKLIHAQKLLDHLTYLGILAFSPTHQCFKPVPADEIPSHIRLPEHLQRSAS